jgi:hypothetical protein
VPGDVLSCPPEEHFRSSGFHFKVTPRGLSGAFLLSWTLAALFHAATGLTLPWSNPDSAPPHHSCTRASHDDFVLHVALPTSLARSLVWVSFVRSSLARKRQRDREDSARSCHCNILIRDISRECKRDGSGIYFCHCAKARVTATDTCTSFERDVLLLRSRAAGCVWSTVSTG